MIPIADDNIKGARKPIFTVLFLIINILAFIYEISLSQEELNTFIHEFGVVPVDIRNGENLFSLFTSMFLHGGWLHLIGNMLFLWVFGDNIEHHLGHLWFIAFYILGGLAASFVHIFFNWDSIIPSIGASGAISAILGSYLVLYPKSKVRMLIFLGFFITTIRVNAFIFLLVWIGIQVFSGMADLNTTTAQTAGVAYWAHIGGFVFGLLIGFILLIGGKRR